MTQRDLVIVTGSAGLVGSEAARFFAERGFCVLGVDNDMRARLFGADASTAWNRRLLEETVASYRHAELDIRDSVAIDRLFAENAARIALVIHAAAQPSHDWAMRAPVEDFTINANGTLNLLEATRGHCRDVPFIFTSTNKVYGDRPNRLPLVEMETRWELPEACVYGRHGIDETMSIDDSFHSLFGASKIAADVMVQEYGRSFGMNTVVFRAGCLTGPSHSGTELHGFLAYLMRCAAVGAPYTVYGYLGKQVRDNLHSADLVRAFWHFFENPRPARVYNIGGGRACNCSMLEAIATCGAVAGRPLDWRYDEHSRPGDHIWWISDSGRFAADYPGWSVTRNIADILEEIHSSNRIRWAECS